MMARSPGTFKPPWQRQPEVRAEQAKRYDERRGSARARGYDARWERARIVYLSQHPLCVCCKANGVVHEASLIDHVIAHRGDRRLFWDVSNWQALCKWCHDNVKSPLERSAAAGHLLRLDRIVPGWVHPADR